MNQDFALPAKAGLARRLVKMSAFMAFDIDDSVRQLAETDLITDADYESIGLSVLDEDRDVFQSLFDFEFRAIIPTADRTARAIYNILAAARLANIESIFISTTHPLPWKKVANGQKLIDRVTFFIPKESKDKVETEFKYDPDEFKNKRDGLLIIDDNSLRFDRTMTAYHPLMMMDFPKTIIVTEKQSLIELEPVISMMFPGAPVDLLVNTSPLLRRHLAQMGIKDFYAKDIMSLFNMVSTYLPDPRVHRY